MTDKEKILLYLDYKGINKNRFSLKTGLSTRFLDSGNSLGVDKLRIIAHNYTDLNIDWVVTGRGEMIKSNTLQTVAEESATYPKKRRWIEDFAQEIDNIKRDIISLKKNNRASDL